MKVVTRRLRKAATLAANIGIEHPHFFGRIRVDMRVHVRARVWHRAHNQCIFVRGVHVWGGYSPSALDEYAELSSFVTLSLSLGCSSQLSFGG